MEDAERGTQLDLWTLLGTTQAVVDATGRKLVRPGKAASIGATDPARFDARNSGKKVPAGAGTVREVSEAPHFTSSEPMSPQRGKEKDMSNRFGGRVNDGTLPNAGQAAKGMARIAAAKHGNAFVVVRRRD